MGVFEFAIVSDNSGEVVEISIAGNIVAAAVAIIKIKIVEVQVKALLLLPFSEGFKARIAASNPIGSRNVTGLFPKDSKAAGRTTKVPTVANKASKTKAGHNLLANSVTRPLKGGGTFNATQAAP